MVGSPGCEYPVASAPEAYRSGVGVQRAGCSSWTPTPVLRQANTPCVPLACHYHAALVMTVLGVISAVHVIIG